MKFLIKESQFDNLVFKYLDNQDFVKDATKDDIFFLNSIDDEQGVIVFDKKKGMLYISWALRDEISSFFSIRMPFSELTNSGIPFIAELMIGFPHIQLSGITQGKF